MSHSWHEIDRLLVAALDQPKDERAAFLERETAGDEALLLHVMALLRAADQSTGDFQHLAPSLAVGLAEEVPGNRLGPYRLEKQIGRGGMGLVYLATREVGGAQQRVGLKVVRPELASLADPAALARFQQEQEVLAGLEHPHIARLLDAGRTDAGLPYLAMEYVPGDPITAYCDAHALPLAGRLALMAQVARAVEYAHRRLVVHRDLKPGNVLITEGADGQPVPKLLDFGIAKLLDADAALGAPLTRTDARPLTPGYAAPEQITGAPITTATDVYALGVMLYELVAGRRPFVGDTQSELELAVLREEPDRPSTQARHTATAAVGVRPDSLQGDVDVICLKAISKEPERRYASAAALADDIERHLAGFPIEARPATRRYRTSRFIRRNRVPVLAAAAILLALVGGLSAALWQARAANLERDRATEEARRADDAAVFLTGLLKLGNPLMGDTSIPISALTDSGFVRLQEGDDMDPLLRARLFSDLGEVYGGQGNYTQQEAATAAAVDILRAYPDQPLRLSAALRAHALALYFTRRLDEAEVLAREAFTVLDGTPTSMERSKAAYTLAMTLGDMGREEEVVALIDAVLSETPRSEWGRDDAVQAPFLLMTQAFALSETGQNERAVQAGQEALDLYEEIGEGDSHTMVIATFNYAVILLNVGRYPEAEMTMRRVLQVEEEKLSPDNPKLAATVSAMGIMTLLNGRFEDAIAFSDRAEATYAATFGDGGDPTVANRIVGAVARYATGARGEAIERLRRAERTAEPSASPEDLAALRFTLGHVLRAAPSDQIEGERLLDLTADALPPDRRTNLLRYLSLADARLADDERAIDEVEA